MVFFFFDHCKKSVATEEFCCDRIPLSCAPNLGVQALLRAPSLVCRKCARLARSVARAWPSLLRSSTAPHRGDRVPLSLAHSLVAAQFLVPLSRHRTLCCNTETPCLGIFCRDGGFTLLRHKLKQLCHDIKFSVAT